MTHTRSRLFELSRFRPLQYAVLLLLSAVLNACAGGWRPYQSRTTDPRPTNSVSCSAEVRGTVAIIGVDVLPMNGDRVLLDQTVLIEGDRIAMVGSRRSVRVPGGALRIDGRGRYLAPGLVDFHTHSKTARDLQMYAARGVTTIVDMGNFDAKGLHARRDSIRAQSMIGPSIISAFLVDGVKGFRAVELHGAMNADTPAEARLAVATARARGFDLLKVYNSIPDSAFFELMTEAARLGVPVGGHGVRSVGLARSMTAGQRLVVHSEEFVYAYFTGPVERIDDAQIAGAIDAIRASRTFVVPNLSAFEVIAAQWGRQAAADSMLALPEAASLDPYWRDAWKQSGYANRSNRIEEFRIFLGHFSRALGDADVPILLGTDSPIIPGMIPGLSLHQDMDLLIRAGISPYKVLSAGTRASGEYLARELPSYPHIGRVAVGSRADLLLVDRNPLVDLATLRAPRGVVLAGRWMGREQITACWTGAQR